MKPTILLVSTAYQIKGHAYNYINNLIYFLHSDFQIDILIGEGNHQNELNTLAKFKIVDVDFESTSAENFSKFGIFANTFRGINKIKKNYFFYNQLAKLENLEEYQAIYLMDYDYLVLNYFLLKNRKLNNIFVWIHSASFSSRNVVYTLYKQLVKKLFQHSLIYTKRIVVNDLDIKDKFIEHFPNAKQKVEVVPFFSRIKNNNLKQSTTRKKFGIPVDENVIIYFGVLRKEKNYRMAFKILSETKTKPLLIIAGAENSISKADLLRYAKSYDYKNFKLLIRYFEENEIDELYSIADALLMTYDKSLISQSGPFSIALQKHLPVITTNDSLIGNLVKNYTLGISNNSTLLPEKIDFFFVDKLASLNNYKHNINQYTKLRNPEDSFSRYKKIFLVKS